MEGEREEEREGGREEEGGRRGGEREGGKEREGGSMLELLHTQASRVALTSLFRFAPSLISASAQDRWTPCE